MKQLLKPLRWLMCLAVILPALALTGCKDDDKDEPQEQGQEQGAANLNGEWEAYWEGADVTLYIEGNRMGMEVHEGDYDTWYAEAYISVSGNTITITRVIEDDGLGWREGTKMTFSLSGNLLTVNINGESIRFTKYTGGDDDWNWSEASLVVAGAAGSRIAVGPLGHGPHGLQRR